MDALETISPLDGRYNQHTRYLAEIFSEKGLMEHRLMVEGEYLIALSINPEIKTRIFTKEEVDQIRSLYNLSLENAKIIKQIETRGYESIPATNHDVKAVEYYLKNKLKNTSLKDSIEWIHFALTSEDINNIAYSIMLSTSINETVLKEIQELHEKILKLAKKYRSIPMLARTHGQPASPTTLGKEFYVFARRLERQISQLKKRKILVKLNGATGNYNAHISAYPNIDWIKFTKEFIEKLNQERKTNLRPNLVTTQIEPHDSYIELFDNLRRINSILIDFNQDIWRYISDNYLIQKPTESEIGSSTMPHKVNPIDFENSEGNLGIANSLFTFFQTKLPISRLQRDLSDSTVERNFGTALGHCLIGYKSILRGLNKIEVNEEEITRELESHPEVISEAIQTILRRENIQAPYEKLKILTRGQKVTLKTFYDFINSLNIPRQIKEELARITPKNYTGLSEHLVP